MTPIRRIVDAGCYYFLPVLLLIVLAQVFDKKIQFDAITIQTSVIAEEKDLLSLYWPTSSGYYAEEQSANSRYAAGTHTLELKIRDYSPHHELRLDPMSHLGSVQITELIVGRFGVRHSINPVQLGDHLSRSANVKVTKTPFALKAVATADDAQLFLADLPIPLLGYTRFFFYGLVGLYSLVLLWLLQRRRGRIEVDAGLHRVVSTSVLTTCCWIYTWSFLLTLAVLTALLYSVWRCISHWKSMSFSPGGRIAPFVVSAFFLVLIIVPLVRQLTPGNQFLDAARTDLEKFGAALAELDNKKMGASIKDLENTHLGQFPYRMDLIHLNANVKLFGLGYSPTAKAVLGKQGMFFEGYGERRVEGDDTAYFDNITDYMGLIPFSDDELEAWRVCLEERYYWLHEQGADYVFALAPSKALIYVENLPEKLLATKQALGKPTRYEQLADYMKRNSPIPFVNLSVPLRQEKLRLENEGLLNQFPLYYRTDFHWTYYGAYIAYLAIVDAINTYYPKYSLAPTALKDFTIKRRYDWVHVAFMYSLGLDPVKHRNDTYLTFMPHDNNPLSKVAGFGKKGINDHSLPESRDPLYKEALPTGARMLHNGAGELDTIFVIGDSFSEKYFGYFSTHAKQTVNYRTVYRFMPKPVKIGKPDLVIQEVLNMYLLRPPPTNPSVVREARIRALKERG